VLLTTAQRLFLGSVKRELSVVSFRFALVKPMAYIEKKMNFLL
jgi:hypothetical protein